MIVTFYTQKGPDVDPKVIGTATLDKRGRAIWDRELNSLFMFDTRLPDPAEGKKFLQALPERYRNAPYFWAELT